MLLLLQKRVLRDFFHVVRGRSTPAMAGRSQYPAAEDLRSGVENRVSAGYARTMDTNPADTILHFIAKITDAIEFPVGDAEFDAVLDDCIAALEGAPSPAEDRARAERSLRALLDQTDRLGIPVPEDLRNEIMLVLAATIDPSLFESGADGE